MKKKGNRDYLCTSNASTWNALNIKPDRFTMFYVLPFIIARQETHLQALSSGVNFLHPVKIAPATYKMHIMYEAQLHRIKFGSTV